MTKPLCNVLIPGPFEPGFIRLKDILSRSGLSLINPGNSKITSWTDEGEQIEIAASEVSTTVSILNISNIQFWKTAEEDVFVSWRLLQGGTFFSLYLNGLQAEFEVMLITRLVETVLTTFRDQYGETQALSIAFE